MYADSKFPQRELSKLGIDTFWAVRAEYWHILHALI